MLARLRKVTEMPPREIAARTVRKLFGRGAEHHFMDRVLNMPSPVWRPPYPWRRFTPEHGRQLIEQLRRDGLVMLSNFFDEAQLACIRAAVEAQFRPTLSGKMEFRANDQFYACIQPLSICREFSEAAIDPDLLNLVSGYFRRRPFLSESDFRRVMPLDMVEWERKAPKFAKGYSASHWHHDVRGRQIKVMIYLTDVGPDDQNFSYCLGTHTGFKSMKYENSRFSDEQVQAMKLEILECLAPAGTAIAFDTNGIHRLRRRPTGVRDTVTLNYHPGQMYRMIPQVIHPEVPETRREEFARVTVIAAGELRPETVREIDL